MGTLMSDRDWNQQIKEELSLAIEPDYAKFSAALIPGVRNLLGVRIPTLRKIAKKIAKENWTEYIVQALDDSFEEVNIQGLVLAYADAAFAIKEPYVRTFLNKIQDWSICDGFCSTLKDAKCENEQWWIFLNEYSKSKEEFHLRFVVVMWMRYFVDAEHIDHILQEILRIEHQGYYYKMGAAWCLAESYLYFPQKIEAMFNTGQLDFFIQNKGIQKICESLRVEESDKQRLRKLKRDKKLTKFL